MSLKERIIALAKENSADYVGFAPISRFEADDPIFKIMPETKTVICLAFGIPRGIYRGVEEGTTYYQYTTMAVENMEETVMPFARLAICNLIESEGYIAMPQRRQQTVMQSCEGTNPEVGYGSIKRGVKREPELNFLDTAVKCGVGEKGLYGALLTDGFGPMVRYCFVLTDAALEADEIAAPHLCDKCGKCVKACPGKAIAEDGSVNDWQCAVYYSGASGLRNPFMNPEAYPGFEERLAIIAGEAKVTPERAKQILDATYFYPPAKHNYQSCICGKACDIECYVHLEEKGALKNNFSVPFRKREKWEFDISDFDI